MSKRARRSGLGYLGEFGLPIPVDGPLARVKRLEQAPSRLDPHAIVLATGYQRGLETLVGHLGVLDDAGKPAAQGVRAAAPGLRFLGFETRPSLIGYIGKQAGRMARRIAQELR
ncbi:hypothetical protein ABGB19_14850 [Mycobacterium sp. B14F4]|uniref:hypothetical protein n=1 Tax=Mycobacterium sp. B14F4 TaxID=3153565 RepID=UPI00325CA19B